MAIPFKPNEKLIGVSLNISYGDKTPKYIYGRVFGVLWILLGLLVMAMFTATAVSALTISGSDLAILEGNKVKKNENDRNLLPLLF